MKKHFLNDVIWFHNDIEKCVAFFIISITKITFLLGKLSPFYLNIKGMSIVYLNMNTKSNSYLRTIICFLRYQMKVDWYFICDMCKIISFDHHVRRMCHLFHYWTCTSYSDVLHMYSYYFYFKSNGFTVKFVSKLVN